MRVVSFALVALLLAGCNSSDSLEDGSAEWTGGGAVEESERDSFDEQAAREEAEAEVASEGYSGPCTFDCSGHDAGFTYAAEGNPDGGQSDSQSFDEGQEAHEEAVQERVEEARTAYEDGEEL